MNTKARHHREINNERSVASFIPYSSHVSDTTIITKDGDYLRTWRIAGVAFETVDHEEIFRLKDQLNTLLRSIASNQIAVWSHVVRRRTHDKLDSYFNNEFCEDFDHKYYESFKSYQMMANELYFTVVYRPNPTALDKKLSKSANRNFTDILNSQKESIRKLDDIGFQIEASLHRYGSDSKGIEALGCYKDNNIVYSNLLSFLNFLVSGSWQKVRVPMSPLSNYLGTSHIMVGYEAIEIRSPTQTRFAMGLDFKDYTSHTEPGLLDGLFYEDYEFIMTQSFSFMSKNQGKDFLDKQRAQMINAQDGSETQIDQLTNAIDELIQGKFVMGEYHFSLFVFGNTVLETRQNITSAMAIIQDLGFLAAVIAVATDAAYYAQLPCNWAYRPRIAGLTSRNFAGLSSFHNFRAGKRDNNPWGQAVTLFKTPSGQPLYFNFHYSKDGEDAYDKKVLGNTRIIGQSGSGKTVLMNMLFTQAQKFKHRSPSGFASVFLDKDRGAELAIRAIGGKYFRVENGQPTGFNPLQIENTESNLLFLEKLIKTLVTDNGNKVTTTDEAKISHAVRSVMHMPREYRRLSVLLQNIPDGMTREEQQNSIAQRLAKWCFDDGNGHQGVFWWVFDNPEDQLDFTTHDNYGIDGTAFLDNKDIRTPVSMYILHRMEEIIDGRRFIYWMDEAWKWVDDEAFSEFAGNKQLTIRKQNGLGVFATQMPSSLLNSKIASSLVQQVATEIYLPNPKADFDEYVNGFKCTEREYRIVRDLAEDSRMFLIKQGQQSMIARFDLGNIRDSNNEIIVSFDDELAILSGSTDNLELLDVIMSEVGEDPKNWLPIFHERRKYRIAKSRRSEV